MKAIANGQVDGFPDRNEVLTIYVAHDIQSAEEDPMVVDYLADDPSIKQKGLSYAKCKKTLEDIGFGDDRLNLRVSALSGMYTAGMGDCIVRRTAVFGCYPNSAVL